MATTSEVKAALDLMAQDIAAAINLRQRAKDQLKTARDRLAAIPSTYSDELATINAYTPTGAFEELSKDEKAKLQTEFNALKNAIETELTAIGVAF